MLSHLGRHNRQEAVVSLFLKIFLHGKQKNILLVGMMYVYVLCFSPISKLIRLAEASNYTFQVGGEGRT